MKAYLVARPSFIQIPPEMGTPRADQMVGTDAEKIIELAGRACYDSLGKGRNSAEYHQHILDVAHGSVLAHANFTFFITGVSRGLTHELVRHAIGIGISQRSTRYVDESASPWIKHPLFVQYLEETADNDLLVDWDDAVANCEQVYDRMVEKLEAFCIAKGVDKLGARKQARGAARGILGNALETEMIWSANVRALRWVLEQRGSDAADAEIRSLALALYDVVKAEIPAYALDYVLAPATDGLGQTITPTHHKV